MAIVSGIITYNIANKYATFKNQIAKTFNITLPSTRSYEIGIDQSTSCTGIFIKDNKDDVNIMLEVARANISEEDYRKELFGLIGRIIDGKEITLIVCEKPVPKFEQPHTFRVLTKFFSNLEIFLETNPNLSNTSLESIYPQSWKSRIIDKNKGTGRINSKRCCAEDLCDVKPLLWNYIDVSPNKDLDGFDACGILLGYKKCAFTEDGRPKIYGDVEKRHKTMVYYRYVDISVMKTTEDFAQEILKPIRHVVNYLKPKFKVYNIDYNLLKNIKMASSKYQFTITQLPDKVLEPLHWKFNFEYDKNKVMIAYIVKEKDFRSGDITVLNTAIPWHIEYGAMS